MEITSAVPTDSLSRHSNLSPTESTQRTSPSNPAGQAMLSREAAATGNPGWQIRGFQDAFRTKDVKPPWVIEDLLMEQSATLVSAHPHSMKSLSWLQACLEAVAKKTVWGHFAAPNVESALFIETEDPVWLVETRIRGLAQGLGIGEDEHLPGFHYACIGPFALEKEEEQLNRFVEDLRLNVIVISTLQNTLEGRNWLSQEQMQPIMAMIVRLSRRCPTVLLTHSPWDSKQKRAAGTVTQAANFLTTMHFEKKRNQKSNDTFAHVTTDSKAGAVVTDFTLKLETEGADLHDLGSVRRLVYVNEGPPRGLGKDAVLAALKDDPDASAKEIAETVGVSPRYVQRIRKTEAKREKKSSRSEQFAEVCS